MPSKPKKEERLGGLRTLSMDVDFPVDEVPPERFGIEEDEVKMRILVTPMEAGWRMGAPLQISLRGTEPFFRLLEMIDEYKELDCSRYDVIVPPKKDPVPKDSWSFIVRRLGLHDKSNITLSPKYPSLFLWHPLKVYEAYWIEKVFQTVEEAGEGGISYSELRTLCPRPRPLHDRRPKSLIRRYPDKFYVEVEHYSQKMTVFLNEDRRLPLFFVR